MARKIQLIFLLSVVCGGCVSRAPTECELDKRSGLYPSSFCEGKIEKSDGLPVQRATAAGPRPNEIPVRSEPLVKKIWIHDQILEGGHWMQGTWAYIEVEPSKWVGSRTSGQQRNAQAAAPSITVPLPVREPKQPPLPNASSPRLGGKQ